MPASTTYFKDMYEDVETFMLSQHICKTYTLDIFKTPKRICFSLCHVVKSDVERILTKPVYRWCYSYETQKYAIPIKRYNNQSLFTLVCKFMDGEPVEFRKPAPMRIKANMQVFASGDPSTLVPRAVRIEGVSFHKKLNTGHKLLVSIDTAINLAITIASLTYATITIISNWRKNHDRYE